MFDTRKYRPEDAVAVDEFLRAQQHATLLAAAPGEPPQASLLPFVFLDDTTVELHAVRADPTFRALEANPAATLLVSDFLAYTPHQWIDEEDQSESTLHFQAVLLHGTATLSVEPRDVAAALSRLTEAYGHGPRARPIAVDDDMYASQLRRLGVVRLSITDRQAKFKTGGGTAEQRRVLAQQLWDRGEPNDARAATIIDPVAARLRQVERPTAMDWDRYHAAPRAGHGRAHAHAPGTGDATSAAELTGFLAGCAELPNRAIDLGCGTGHDAVLLAGYGIDVTGVDASAVALEHARARAARHEVQVRWIHGDALRLQVDDGSIDLALDHGFLHHVAADDRDRYVAEVARLLRPGGTLLIRDRAAQHAQAMSESDIRAMVGDSPLRVRSVRTSGRGGSMFAVLDRA